MGTPETTTATRLQVLYATKGEDHIECIGGRNPDGSLWTMTRDEAIREMNEKTLKLFVHSRNGGDFRVDVDVIGGDYLRTRGDGVAVDNLLSLPDCPAS